MKFYSKKIINLVNADIHLHYANNKGRGSDNVTVTIVPTGTARLPVSAKYENPLKQYRTSGWAGNVNISNDVIAEFGGLK